METNPESKAMIRSNIYKNITLLMIILLFSGFTGNLLGQQSNTLYYMNEVPQSHLLNPATQPECSFYLGFPGLSPFYFSTDNSSLSLKNILWYDPELDSVITFLHPKADLNSFLKNFGKANYITEDVNLNIISFGFSISQMFFSFDLTMNESLKFTYPGDLVKFILEGNSEGDVIDLSNTGIDINNYTAMAFGASRKISEELTVGAKVKMLFGLANLSTSNTDIQINTAVDQWNLRSKFDVNASLPGVTIPTNSDGNLDFDNLTFNDNLQVRDYKKMFTKNFGLGLDLGAHYKPIDKLTVSASLLDLGYIRWKSYTYNMTQDASFDFEGIPVDFNNDSSDFGQMLLDSLKNTFTLTNSNDPYTTHLNGKLYLGARYQIIKQIGFGFLSRTEMIKGKLRQQFTLSTNFYPIKGFAASISYSIMNKTYNNLGFGISGRLGPLNLYLISDNIPLTYYKVKSSPAIIPVNTRTFNLRLGLNLVFGTNQQKKIMKDKPLVF